MKKIDKKNLQAVSKKKVKTAFEDYKAFALKGNVLDLAIGVVLGSAFTNIVNSIVNSIITPLISMLTSKVNYSTLFVSLDGIKYESIEAAKAANAVILTYGELISAILNFIIVSIILFLIIKTLTKASKKEKIEEIKTTKKCNYCCSSIPIEATKCAHCTSDLLK